MRAKVWLSALGLAAAIVGCFPARLAHAGGRVLVANDTVRVTVLADPDLSETMRVELDGTVVFPYVGRLKAAGLTEDQLARTIERRLVEKRIIAPN